MRDLKIKRFLAVSPESVIQAAICCLYAVAATTPIAYPSELWHLTVGRWIYHKVALPFADIWSLPGVDNTWHATGWLSQLIIAAAFQFGGFRGLAILKAGLVFVLVYSLVCCCATLARSRFLGVVIGLLSVSAALDAVELEPALFGLSCFALYLTLIYRLIDAVALEEHYFPIVLICALWTNLHSSAALLLPAAFFLLIDIPSLTPSSKGRALKMALAIKVGVVSLVGLLISPYMGVHLLNHSRWVISSFTLDLLVRSHPASIFQYGFAMCVILAVLLSLVLASGKWPAGKGEIVFALISLTVTAAYSDFSPWCGVILGLLLSRAVGKAGGIQVGSLDEALLRLKSFFEAWPRVGSVWIILVVSIILGNGLLREPVQRFDWPARELDYILSNLIPRGSGNVTQGEHCPQLIHSSLISGYVISRFSNESGEPLLRASISPETKYYAPHDALVEGDLWRVFPGWDLVLSSPESPSFAGCAAAPFILVRLIDPLYQVLVRDPRWELVLFRGDRVGPDSVKGRSFSELNTGRLGWAVLRRK